MILLCAFFSLHHNLQMLWSVSSPICSFCLTISLYGRLSCKQRPPQGTPLLPISFLINFSEVWSIPLSHWIGMMCSLVSFLDYISLYTGSPDLYPAFTSSQQCLNHSKHIALVTKWMCMQWRRPCSWALWNIKWITTLSLPIVSGYQSGVL